MIVRRIRLKNIKSFGTGPEGEGVSLGFDHGLNRIGGPNGSGKSSIIEAIGYALFDAEPVRGDNRIKVETYLVRHGCKTGAITVWIETGECQYRVERDVGQVLRRWKVVREDDGFIEAEGEADVRQLLASFWGLPGPERLEELFHGLIGVKQGRFILPFDCTPTMARNHFDPLLDVDIFRKCFDYLLEPLHLLGEEEHRIEKVLSELDGGIAQLMDAPERLKQTMNHLTEARTQSEQAEREVSSLKEQVAADEAAFTAKIETEKAQLRAKNILQDRQTQQAVAAKEYNEASAAAKVIQETRGDYEAYRAAEAEARQWESKRQERDSLVGEKNRLQIEQGRLDEERRSRSDSARSFGELAQKKALEVNRREACSAETEATLRKLADQDMTLQKRFDTCNNQMDQIRIWMGTLQLLVRQFQQELPVIMEKAKQLTDSDRPNLCQAAANLEAAQKHETEAKVALGRAQEKRHHISQQLTSLEHGICPFLGERCQQFNPEELRNQLETVNQNITVLEQELSAATASTISAQNILETVRHQEQEYNSGKQELQNGLDHLAQRWQEAEHSKGREAAAVLQGFWPAAELPDLPSIPADPDLCFWDEAGGALRELSQGLEANLLLWRKAIIQAGKESQMARAEFVKEQGLFDHENSQICQIRTEADDFQKRTQIDLKRIEQLERHISLGKQHLATIDQSLADYGGLDQQLTGLRERLELLKPNYTRFLQQQPLAAKLEVYELQLAKVEKEVAAAIIEVQKTEQQAIIAASTYNAVNHKADQIRLQQALEIQGQAGSRLSQAQADFEEQRSRQKLFEELEQKKAVTFEELDKVRSRLTILEKARLVLKNSQNLVAQGLTRKIQLRAQTIYNTMSKEPAQFEWEAGDYRLTLHTAGGPRRFTQLSGGQQMKVALAMQLALVKEFSGAGFCAFDEPTYGLDAPSRALLAEAIAKVEVESGFEQLLVVTHDDAFDDKVEHLVNLEYHPVGGTEPRELG